MKTPVEHSRAPITAVITGDIVDSTRLNETDRVLLTKALEGIPDGLRSVGLVVRSLDIFRGDSFQVILEEPALICDAALFLRAWFRRVALPDNSVLDTRLGLGLGPVEFHAENESLSDGSAFRFAAKSLEQAYADKLGITRFTSGSDPLNAQINALFIAIEPYVSRWTAPQAESLWWSMQEMTQTDIAAKLDVAQSTVARALQSAHDKTISHVRVHLHDLIKQYLSENTPAK